jgi:hypothetical protein
MWICDLGEYGEFFLRKPLSFVRRGQTLNFEAVYLDDGMSWILEPVYRNMCKFESLKDGSVDLSDIALMNDKIVEKAENEFRAREAARGK